MSNYHPCTHILIEGLKRLPGGQQVLSEWDKSRYLVDQRISRQQPAKETPDENQTVSTG